MPGSPFELAPDLARIDGVAAIVAGPVRHERLQIPVARTAVKRGVGRGRSEDLERVADAIDDFEVGPLVAAADVVFLAHSSLPEHQQDACTMIVDMEPVAHVRAI